MESTEDPVKSISKRIFIWMVIGAFVPIFWGVVSFIFFNAPKSLWADLYWNVVYLDVLDSDGTAILCFESLKGGTLYTHDVCRREHKPYIVLDATRIDESGAAAAVVRFIKEHEIQVLNVAGPRASKWAEGYAFALAVVG